MTLRKNLIVSVIFILLWGSLIVIEVKVENFPVLKYLFFSSWGLIISGYIWANYEAHPSKGAILNIAQGISIAAIFIILGIILGTNFKLLIGGHV